MLIASIAKSFLTGICAAAPAGPVAAMVAQRTLSGGRKAGLACGAGSAMADTLFAAVGLLTIGLVKDLVDRYAGWLCLCGGALLLAIGVVMALSPNKGVGDRAMRVPAGKKTLAGYALQTFFSAIANPAALGVMMVLLAFYGLDATTVPVWLALPLVFAGEFCWWTVMTSVFLKLECALSAGSVSRAMKALGVAVAIFGAALLVKGLITLF